MVNRQMQLWMEFLRWMQFLMLQSEAPILIKVAILWEIFILASGVVLFAGSYLLALSMPGWRSLGIVGLAALAVTIDFLVSWIRGHPTLSLWSVREAYMWHLAILPLMLGLVGGVTVRAIQLRLEQPRIEWLSTGLFASGLFVRPDPWINLFAGG
jgi:hypothetical protein